MCGVPPTPTVVPGAPPQNVTGEAVGPTSIRVSWDPPPAERSNGRIVYYKLQVVENGRSDSEAAVITLNATSFVLDELKRWTEYRIWVLAGTSVGDGPPSFPITVRTHEDGTYIIKQHPPGLRVAVWEGQGNLNSVAVHHIPHLTQCSLICFSAENNVLKRHEISNHYWLVMISLSFHSIKHVNIISLPFVLNILHRIITWQWINLNEGFVLRKQSLHVLLIMVLLRVFTSPQKNTIVSPLMRRSCHGQNMLAGVIFDDFASIHQLFPGMCIDTFRLIKCWPCFQKSDGSVSKL